MKSVFNDMEGFDLVIHNLHKVDSKMNAGRFFDARRELLRVVSVLEKNRQDLRDYLVEKLDKLEERDGQDEK